MAYAVQFEFRGIDALKTKQVNDAIKRALVAMGKRWRRRYLPKHFTHKGAREYGYKRRVGETGSGGSGRPIRKIAGKITYTWKKWKLHGHTLPLVYTGELRRQSLYGPPKIKATCKNRGQNANVRVSLPRKANFVIKDMTAVSRREIIDLQKFLADQVERELRREGTSATATAHISAS